MLSHEIYGNLLYQQQETNKYPVYNFLPFLSLSPNLVLGFCSADITPGGGHHSFIFFLLAHDFLKVDLIWEFFVQFLSDLHF